MTPQYDYSTQDPLTITTTTTATTKKSFGDDGESDEGWAIFTPDVLVAATIVLTILLILVTHVSS